MKPTTVTINDLIQLAKAKGLSLRFLACEIGIPQERATSLELLFHVAVIEQKIDPSVLWDDIDNFITGG